MERVHEIERSGGPGIAVIPSDAGPLESLKETTSSPCRWPTVAITGRAMLDVDAALAADPLFHLCPDGHKGRVDVRYWYFHPLNLSCRHCAEGGGVPVVEPETVVCRHRMAGRTAQPLLEH